jgi:hypothetical protein
LFGPLPLLIAFADIWRFGAARAPRLAGVSDVLWCAARLAPGR